MLKSNIFIAIVNNFIYLCTVNQIILRCNSLILIRKDKGNYDKKQRFRRKKG
jgi:hypothetical protein